MHVVVQTAQDFSFECQDSIILGHVAEPGLLHFVGSFVGHGEKIDSSHLHLEYDFSVVLFYSHAFIVVQRFVLCARRILFYKLCHDVLGDEDEVNTFSEALFYLIVLPREFYRDISGLVGLLGQEQIAEGDSSRLDRSIYAAQFLVGLAGCGVDNIYVTVGFPLFEPLLGKEVPLTVNFYARWHVFEHQTELVPLLQAVGTRDYV